MRTRSDGMPVFVIKAQDALAVPAVAAYRDLCLKAGLVNQAAEVTKAIEEIEAWQQRKGNRVKVPDHRHLPASPRGRRP